MEFGKLPAEVLGKIASYQIGEPEYVKTKNSQALKDTQKKYKSRTYGLETQTDHSSEYDKDYITENSHF